MPNIKKPLELGFLTVLFCCINSCAFGQTNWTDWTEVIFGIDGSASGLLDGVAVSYTGQALSNSVVDGSSNAWNPETSFTGGQVLQSPAEQGDIITLDGGNVGLQTIEFSQAIENPVIAIWSLGRLDDVASFAFLQTPTFQAGGPNSSFGGNPITVAGNIVSGLEGNGVVLFDGTFDSISFSSTPEFFYGFTVGTSATAVPEPSSATLLATLMISVTAFKRRRSSHRTN